MKYWVVGITAVLTLLAANPVRPAATADAQSGSAYASVDSGAPALR